MIFNMTGGIPLNFKVKAYASADLLPATAAENTIAIITETPISEYMFSVEQPENPVDGMVWVATGTGSPSEFNALKKNGLQVYPQSAMQYIGGAWENVTAKSYQNGEWVVWWDGTLFNLGDQYEHVTGGWQQFKLSSGATLTIGTTIVYSAGANESQKMALARTVNLIPFGGYKTLYFTISKVSNTGGSLVVYDENDSTIVTNYTSGSAGTYSVDVSELNGNYYVAVGGHNGRKGEISKVWLER